MLIITDVNEKLAGTDALCNLDGEWFAEWEGSFGMIEFSFLPSRSFLLNFRLLLA